VVRATVYPFVSGYTVEGTAVSTAKMQSALGKKVLKNGAKPTTYFDPTKAEVTQE
jgi:hypothetical protein